MPLLKVEGITKEFFLSSGFLRFVFGNPEKLRAVDHVDFTLDKGGSFGLAGESGCGKTTTGKLVMKLHEPTEGRIMFNDRDITNLAGKELKSYRKKVQMIFQDPYESLNPRLSAFGTIKEGLDALGIAQTKKEKRENVLRALEQVNLDPDDYKDKLPFELSGGECQRLMIGSAIVLNPELIVADEPVSMLDVSIRASILDLIEDVLTPELNLTRLYISHDLSVLKHVVDNVAIMYLGRVVEVGKAVEVLSKPLHPYTKALTSAVPVPDPNYQHEELQIKGSISTTGGERDRCIFEPRCPEAVEVCKRRLPELVDVSKSTENEREVGHQVACHLVGEES